MTHYCKKCKQHKSIFDFNIRKGKLIDVCNKCKRRDESLQIHDAIIDDDIPDDLTLYKKCPVCCKVKKIKEDFRSNKSIKIDYYCRECRCEKDNKYHKTYSLRHIDTPNENTLKTCKICNKEKNISEFGNTKMSKDGKQTQCLECTRKYHKTYYKTKDKEKRNEQLRKSSNKRKESLKLLDETTDRLDVNFKTCTKCSIQKPLRDFGQSWNCPDGRRNVCKECHQKHERELFKNDKNFRKMRKEKDRKYAKNHKDKIVANRNKPEVKQRNSEMRKLRKARQKIENPNLTLKDILRTSVRTNFKRYSKTGKVHNSKKYGIDYMAIINHLGPKPGENYEMDHIIPCSVFPDLNEPGIAALLFHFTNYQWLQKEKNIIKWNNIIPDLIREHKLEWICEKIGINLSEHEQNNYLLNIIKEEE